MKLSIALRLGRVSNLPTVWSNVAAGMVLASGNLPVRPFVLLAFAASAFYVGGMFLNDAYDADIDARERPERPIPSGKVTRAEVLRWGYGLLALGLVCVAVASVSALLAAVGTCGLIVLYDRWHKGNPLGPVIMGACRVGLYLIAATAVGTIGHDVWIGAGLLLGWVIGLTYVAKHESGPAAGKDLRRRWPLAFLLAPVLLSLPRLWDSGVLGRMMFAGAVMWLQHALSLIGRGGPSIRDGVVALIAGISLVDALLILAAGRPLLALWAVAAFGATLGFQRFVAGT